MKKTTRISLFALLLLGLGLFFWAVRHSIPRTDTASLSNAPVVSSEQTQQIGHAVAMPKPSLSQLASNVASYLPESKGTQFREGLRNLNHVPIDYYGTVVDQDGNPLPQTLVKWSIAYNDGLLAGHKNGETVTDTKGCFSIVGQFGEALSVIPERTGYKFIATNGGGVYSLMWPKEQRFVTNSDKTEILTLWKLKGGESLVRLSKNFRFSHTNAPFRIDLVRGLIVHDGGDFLVKVVRPLGVVSISRRAAWNVELAAVEGGIQQVGGRASTWAFEAPASGYQQKVRIEMLPDNREWSTSITDGAFLRSREGQVYSKLSFTVVIDEQPDKPCWIRIQSLSNPNGSRNWEEEPGKVKRVSN